MFNLTLQDKDNSLFSFLCQAMVARGDLGAELPIEEVPLLQVTRDVFCRPLPMFCGSWLSVSVIFSPL